MILVTGGAGFIGANLIHYLRQTAPDQIVNVDKLTYAGDLSRLAELRHDNDHIFVRGDIGDAPLIAGLLAKHKPRAIINLAAESHVDRSIRNPDAFIQTNVVGTAQLLNAACHYWQGLPPREKARFRFLHVSTDEVYGSLSLDGQPFSESSPYAPNNPYAASKAASDHLVRSYQRTYGLPVLTTNCCNNYGPHQLPEKLIPLAIRCALSGLPIPIYGDGKNIRDWIYVLDHCAAIWRVLEAGRPGAVYNIGASSEKTNLEIAHLICDTLDEIHPRGDRSSYRRQIAFVDDRPGHDLRYAVDASKIVNELGWTPDEKFETGMRKTVRWYLDNEKWVTSVATGDHRVWVAPQDPECVGAA